MNQYDLNHLFNDLDAYLGRGRDKSDPKRLKANDFELITIDASGICTFRHRTAELTVFFDWKTRKIMSQKT